MDLVERLTLETAASNELIACEHRHRYEFAAPLCRDLRVLDLCCGSGYGSEILAARAREVLGVDRDVATIEMARATVGERSGVEFEAAEAVAFLGKLERGAFDAIVCFEGLEHLERLEDALTLLREHAEAGSRLVLSVPNSKLLHEDNPFHLTDFGYEEALETFGGLPQAVVLPQFLAEGSLIAPDGASGTAVSLTGSERAEPGYANHFVICANVPAEEVGAVHDGRMQLEVAPAYNRHMKALERAYEELRRANARLARQRLGKSGSAAASFLAGADRWRRRAEEAEARLAELEGAPGVPPREAAARSVSAPVPETPDRCMNTWEDRYRRAKENLIPWLESAIDLDGKTVLEYGCGHAPVSCAFAERVDRHIGLDIDAEAIEVGRRMAAERGIENLELEAHSVAEIGDAMSAHRGEVDVVLLYAVLEHLTLEERLETLRLAREVVRPEGFIAICETPNRLFPFDHHTSRLPFFTMLPDQLALMLYERSQRPDFLNAIGEALRAGPEAAAEAMTRWGRGVSYHELELVFGDLADYVAASNYDLALFGERPVQPEELALSRVLERWRPDLAPVFSRAWLDLVLTAWPLERRPAFLRPWAMTTEHSPGVAWTAGERLLLPERGTVLRVMLPRPSSRIVVGASLGAGRVDVTARSEGLSEPLSVTVSGEAAQPHYVSFDLPGPETQVDVDLSRPGEIFFVGYEG